MIKNHALISLLIEYAYKYTENKKNDIPEDFYKVKKKRQKAKTKQKYFQMIIWNIINIINYLKTNSNIILYINSWGSKG